MSGNACKVHISHKCQFKSLTAWNTPLHAGIHGAEIAPNTFLCGAGGVEEGCAGIGHNGDADRCTKWLLQELPEATESCIPGHHRYLGVSSHAPCGLKSMHQCLPNQ